MYASFRRGRARAGPTGRSIAQKGEERAELAGFLCTSSCGAEGGCPQVRAVGAAERGLALGDERDGGLGQGDLGRTAHGHVTVDVGPGI